MEHDASKGCLAGILFSAAAWLIILAWLWQSVQLVVIAVLLCVLAILIGG